MQMRGKGRLRRTISWLCAGLLLLTLAVYRYQTAPLLTAVEFQEIAAHAPEVKPLTWPGYGQAAVATKDLGIVATHGETAPQSTASTAKLMTVLAIMQKKPFSDGRGETITFTADDVARYSTYVAGNGTTAAVSARLQWTQYQALQAILLASANNISDTMAIWAFGSLENYREYAQEMVRKLGMNETTIGTDASGYDASTASTAHDLALLALRVLEEPVLREIMSQQTVTLPVAGAITNTNFLLDHDEIVGMKTGYNPEAGGVFVLAGRHSVDEHAQDIVTVVMGAPGGSSRVAQDDAYALYASAKENFSYQQITTSGQPIGSAVPAWSEAIPVLAKEGVGMFVWSGTPIGLQLPNEYIEPGSQGAGVLTISRGEQQRDIPLTLARPIPQPNLWWRIVARGW